MYLLIFNVVSFLSDYKSNTLATRLFSFCMHNYHSVANAVNRTYLTAFQLISKLIINIKTHKLIKCNYWSRKNIAKWNRGQHVSMLFLMVEIRFWERNWLFFDLMRLFTIFDARSWGFFSSNFQVFLLFKNSIWVQFKCCMVWFNAGWFWFKSNTVWLLIKLFKSRLPKFVDV